MWPVTVKRRPGIFLRMAATLSMAARPGLVSWARPDGNSTSAGRSTTIWPRRIATLSLPVSIMSRNRSVKALNSLTLRSVSSCRLLACSRHTVSSASTRVTRVLPSVFSWVHAVSFDSTCCLPVRCSSRASASCLFSSLSLATCERASSRADPARQA